MTTPAWLTVKPVGRPRLVDGEMRFTVDVECRWWSLSFLRWLRKQVVVEPRILAWPVVLWVFLRWRIGAWRRAR